MHEPLHTVASVFLWEPPIQPKLHHSRLIRGFMLVALHNRLCLTGTLSCLQDLGQFFLQTVSCKMKTFSFVYKKCSESRVGRNLSLQCYKYQAFSYNKCTESHNPRHVSEKSHPCSAWNFCPVLGFLPLYPYCLLYLTFIIVATSLGSACLSFGSWQLQKHQHLFRISFIVTKDL